jgi:tetratricopeptide (TPR) repeat protein
MIQTPTSPVSKAIFISYASQDADAARRICETLRAEGVEIWFDADGGLEHGDEWDAKIRRQIKECVLFIPLISANTQSRLEGYFRIEWELAAQRALGIAAGVPFILPVVIDDTREPEALVPERFRTVQWTRLPGGVISADVKQRYLKLWSHRTGVLKAQEAAASVPAPTASSPASRETKTTRPTFVAGLIGAVVIAAAVIAYLTLKPSRSAAAATPSASQSAAASADPEQLVKHARELIYDPDSARNEFALAENLLRRAAELSPLSGSVWGASALLNLYFNTRGYDFSRERLVRAQAEADKALRLDADSVDALLALGLQRQSMGETERARDFLERASALEPGNSRVILAQTSLMPAYAAKADFLRRNLNRTQTPAELHYYISLNLSWDGRIKESIAALEPAIAIKPFWRVWVQRAYLELIETADSLRAEAWLDRVPDVKRDEPRVAIVRHEAAMVRGDGAAAVRALNSVAYDYFQDNFYEGPKSFLLAQAYELAGQADRAREQWRLAEKRLREKLDDQPDWLSGKAMLALVVQAQSRPTDAKTLIEDCLADPRFRRDRKAGSNIALALMRMGDPNRALKVLLAGDLTSGASGYLSEAMVTKDHRWDPLRGSPDYQAWLRMLREDERVPKRMK